MINQVQNRTNSPSFGTYALARGAKKLPWLIQDIAKNKGKIEEHSNGLFCIYEKLGKNSTVCNTYKLSKFDFLNKFFEKFPAMKIHLAPFGTLKNSGWAYASNGEIEPSLKVLKKSVQDFRNKNNLK